MPIRSKYHPATQYWRSALSSLVSPFRRDPEFQMAAGEVRQEEFKAEHQQRIFSTRSSAGTYCIFALLPPSAYAHTRHFGTNGT
jgi:hypothetical protein